MVLDSIKWPQTRQTIESDDSDDLETETLMVTGFFRQFVQEGKVYMDSLLNSRITLVI